MHAPGDRSQGEVVGVRQVGVPGWVYGWVYGWGIPGSTTQPPCTREEVPDTAERAPEAPAGLEWVVSGTGRVTGGVRAPDHPAGPVGHPRCPPCQDPSGCRLLANKGEIDLIFQ